MFIFYSPLDVDMADTLLSRDKSTKVSEKY